ncbi:hypothetical protein [Pusillimonas sp. ANT_WB101]|uniref:hypothetical protein n=1 Tax=Pusillimonas sp. ANT_WB101 TaxID=2597356 RepID=UPI0011EE4671|nr:hypothetical protein [Pusillimonas sp. ANT_WB101]KAA0910649.1 hypothetical protein FQ179_01870 [Pusillimonas sp. ANT_WB101]
MITITRDPDSGVVDQECVTLNPEKVYGELASHLKDNLTFLGKPPHYWRNLIAEQAQELADEADPEEYEMWAIRYMEQP